MNTYKNAWDFYRDTTRLVADGADLRALYDAMLGVQDSDMRSVDASPRRLREMAQSWSQRPSFLPIRLNELFNGLKVEHTDDYVLAMVAGLGGRHEQEVRLSMLRHDHALREQVFWRIFEVEGGGEISLANIDKFSREQFNWHNSVVLLANEGTLDRSRVLRSCLQALNRDFSAYRAGWFSRVYAALVPKPEEAAADQHLLRLCMGSPLTATVSLGVKQLDVLHKAGLLDAAAFVEACGGAFSGPKAAALQVLRILDALAAKGLVPHESLGLALAPGLGHSHADVQGAAVKALVKWGYAELAHQQRDLLAPAVAAELLPAPGPADSACGEHEVTAAPGEAAIEWDCGGLQAGVPPPRPLHPWTDEDALERYAALLEAPADALEFELALAWLALSANVAATLASLARRARTLAARDEQHYPAALLVSAVDGQAAFLPRRYWQQTAVSLMDGKRVEEKLGKPRALPTVEETTMLPSLVTRLREVAEVVQGRAPRCPLLATPTDTQGWVDADTLLVRFEAARRVGGPFPVDQSQALLRVPPAHRVRAAAAMGCELPEVTDELRIEWRSRASDSLKANGSPQWVWWDPVVHAAPLAVPSATQPGLIASGLLRYSDGPAACDLTAAELGLANPASTLALVAAGVAILHGAAGDDVEHRAAGLLRALAAHPGAWSGETVRLPALGMAAKQGEVRAQAVELFAAAVPARVDAAAAAQGFAACAPTIVLARWAPAFADAAGLAPAAVIAVLTGLLPRLEHQARGIGSLLAVLLDESLRHARPVTDASLRAWLAGFSGASAAAKAAKALLALDAAGA